MRKLVLFGLIAVTAVTAQDVNVCRQGQAMVVPIQSLSPYDEIGGCGANYFFIPSTTSPSATVAPVAAAPMVATASPMPSTMPSASDIPASTVPTVVLDPNAPNPASTPIASASPLSPGMASVLPPNAVVPGNGTVSPSVAQGAMPSPMASGLPSSGASMAQPSAPMMPSAPSAVTPIDTHVDGQHEWQATGSFSHGHMQSVVKADHSLPANADPNDPKTRVLVFLQWFSTKSVYDNPQQVFMFFKKPFDPHGQRIMRIN